MIGLTSKRGLLHQLLKIRTIDDLVAIDATFSFLPWTSGLV